MSRIAASLPDGVFWGTKGISRVSSASEKRRVCDAYFRIRVTGEFESSMVQVHLAVHVYGSRRVELQTVGKGERRDGKPRSSRGGRGRREREREIGGSSGSSGRRERAAMLSSNNLIKY